jgi:DNA-directed RNA polymerase subunit N (RpoN/RPB10)
MLKKLYITIYYISMLYYKCPTCRTNLANKQLPYQEGLDKICKNTKLSQSERDSQKKKLLDALRVINMCCRQRMLTFVSLVDVIK